MPIRYLNRPGKSHQRAVATVCKNITYTEEMEQARDKASDIIIVPNDLLDGLRCVLRSQ